jgi:hypothetical protein
MQIKIHTPTPPSDMLSALVAHALHYTAPKCLYHCIWLGREQGQESYCGVFGDGDNASYEWFIWRKGQLETSDCGYGMIDIALREALNSVDL